MDLLTLIAILQLKVQVLQLQLKLLQASSTQEIAVVRDVCKNVDGIQSIIPSYMFGDGNGNCFDKPIDTSTQIPLPEPESTSTCLKYNVNGFCLIPK